MTYHIVFCFIYLSTMILYSDGISITFSKTECETNERNCFTLSSSNIADLKVKLKSNTDLRQLLQEHVSKEIRETKSGKKPFCAEKYKTTTHSADEEDGTATTKPTTVTPKSICVSDEFNLTDWNMTTSSCFNIIVMTRANYTEAISNCSKLGGRLAAKGIRDGTIVEYLKSNDSIFRSSTDKPYFWIGLQFSNGSWEWSDNAQYTENLTNWDIKIQPKQPQTNAENCALILGSHKWKIHDSTCSERWRYICEKIR